MACKICNYEGLTGIVVDKRPSLDLVMALDAQLISSVVKQLALKKYSQIPKGVATTFWGCEPEYLGASVILDLETDQKFSPQFQCKDGAYVPKAVAHSSCGGLEALSVSKEVVLSQKAMNELLTQAASYLNGHHRLGNYFMLTHVGKGCCNFKGGVIEVSLDEFSELTRRVV